MAGLQIVRMPERRLAAEQRGIPPAQNINLHIRAHFSFIPTSTSSMQRDNSPFRSDPPKESRFYVVAKRGKGWSVVQSAIVKSSKWVHYDDAERATIPLPKSISWKKFKTNLLRELRNTPFSSAVFENDIVAPSEIVACVWVGMKNLKPILSRTICGSYTPNCQWPDEMTEKQYAMSQKF